MPRKDKEGKLAYQREWYAKHSKRVIDKVAAYKKRELRGVCRNCGGPTVGMQKNRIPEWCAKPECASVHRQYMNRKGAMSEHRWAHNPTIVKVKGRLRAFCSCGWQSDWHKNVNDILQEIRDHTGLREKKDRRPDGR